MKRTEILLRVSWILKHDKHFSARELLYCGFCSTPYRVPTAGSCQMNPSQIMTDAAPTFHLWKIEVIHEGKITEEKPVISQHTLHWLQPKVFLSKSRWGHDKHEVSTNRSKTLSYSFSLISSVSLVLSRHRCGRSLWIVISGTSSTERDWSAAL